MTEEATNRLTHSTYTSKHYRKSVNYKLEWERLLYLQGMRHRASFSAVILIFFFLKCSSYELNSWRLCCIGGSWLLIWDTGIKFSNNAGCWVLVQKHSYGGKWYNHLLCAGGLYTYSKKYNLPFVHISEG